MEGAFVGVVAAKADVGMIGHHDRDFRADGTGFFATGRPAPVSLHITVDGKSGGCPGFSRGSVFWGVQ
jgi:hypothetical protein